MKNILLFIARILGLYRPKPTPQPEPSPAPTPPPVPIPEPEPIPAPPPEATPAPEPEPPIIIVGETIVGLQAQGGAAGDGSTDDTLAWEKAMSRIPEGGGTLYIEPGRYHLPNGVAIRNRQNLTIRGAGDFSQILLSADGTDSGKDSFALELQGTVENFNASNFLIASKVRSATAKQNGIGNYSGVIMRGIVFRSLTVEGVNAGLTVNAHLGGECAGAVITDCTLRDMFGTTSGSGYGIVSSGASNVHIENNTIINASRHAIYNGWTNKTVLPVGAWDVIIKNNTIKNHRSDVHNDSFRAAIVVSRSRAVLIDGNTVADGYDGGFEISQVNGDPSERASSDSHTITMRNNRAYNRRNAVPYVLLGEQLAGDPYRLYNVRMEDDAFVTDENLGDGFMPSVYLMNGRNINISGLGVRHTGCLKDGLRRGITLGDSRFGNDTNYVDQVSVTDYVFQCTGTATDIELRPITVDGGLRAPDAHLILPADVQAYYEP